MAFTIANYVTFLTENTLYACKLAMTASLFMMAYHYEDYCGTEDGYG